MTREQAKLQGVWETIEVTTTGSGAKTYRAQPGLVIFTGNHYSITMVSGDTSRNWLEDTDKATADQLREVLRFSANAGTYEVKGGELNLYPVVALRPPVMASSAVLTYAYKLEGNTLSLTWKTRLNVPVLNPATMKLRRIE